MEGTVDSRTNMFSGNPTNNGWRLTNPAERQEGRSQWQHPGFWLREVSSLSRENSGGEGQTSGSSIWGYAGTQVEVSTRRFVSLDMLI